MSKSTTERTVKTIFASYAPHDQAPLRSKVPVYYHGNYAVIPKKRETSTEGVRTIRLSIAAKKSTVKKTPLKEASDRVKAIKFDLSAMQISFSFVAPPPALRFLFESIAQVLGLKETEYSQIYRLGDRKFLDAVKTFKLKSLSLARFQKYDEFVKGVGVAWMKKVSIAGYQLMQWASAAREYAEIAAKQEANAEPIQQKQMTSEPVQVAAHTDLPKQVHAD